MIHGVTSWLCPCTSPILYKPHHSPKCCLVAQLSRNSAAGGNIAQKSKQVSSWLIRDLNKPTHSHLWGPTQNAANIIQLEQLQQKSDNFYNLLPPWHNTMIWHGKLMGLLFYIDICQWEWWLLSLCVVQYSVNLFITVSVCVVCACACACACKWSPYIASSLTFHLLLRVTASLWIWNLCLLD